MVDRLSFYRYPYTAAAENIAWNYVDGLSTVEAWMLSPGHRANILDPIFSEIGAGEAVNYAGQPFYCQVFGRR